MAKARSQAPARKKPANPLLARWSAPFGLPPFKRIEPRHFKSAFAVALKEHKAEIARIAGEKARPTFANTIGALEKSGRLLEKVASVFYNLSGAHTNEALQAIERDMAPKMAAHETAIMLNGKIFKRVEDLYARRDALDLTNEQRRVLELRYKWLIRAGAKLNAKEKARVAEINQRLASLATQFSQNVLKDEQSWRMVLEESDLDGLPDALRESAARAAADMGLAGKYVITLSRSSIEPFLQFSARRDLREEAFNAWIKRGEMGEETDNRAISAEIIALRAEFAALLGFKSYAAYSLEETMAKTPGSVRDLLSAVWEPAVKRAADEREALQARARAEGGNFAIAPWDWRYYAEKERKALYDVDEASTRPYLTLDNVIAAAFETASRLFGLKFKELPDAPRYHEDVRVWKVTDKRGKHVGLFLGDYFARPSKRSGAWMSAYRSQSKVAGEISPIIVNVMNFSKGEEGAPSLLSLDDARTLFHEFGHGLHGLLSDVTYPSISGTSVTRDFVELPSQLYEHWLMVPETLERFAVHHETGKPMPAKLVSRIKKARNFNQGFATIEYLASAFVDMELHAREEEGAIDVGAFERDTLSRLGMPSEIVMRHRIPHFLHIMGGYAAGYYSYLWSEVMDADAFAAFEEAGDAFHAATAKKLHKHIYSVGNARDPLEAYVAFRGRPPEIKGLLKKRGLAG
ncbi:MAG: M3 family metallopeptidase [Hyphomicrobium sp.]|uniref:M3 family metallopeptidase n=1 Tax=Hyphomicrobium sp. TaxID=82 RepID=UPI001320C102|nr:M3 family metallopeptidase [Hyphomicrobium sp.]KAB2944205.1 MAG: M3 family metallopeptidase [Hyphomicrobium sp.]MBZ0209446.1 M3 family metallopeptidase [Hyphomicrobium sp.]